MYGSNFSVVHEGEKDINTNRNKDTSKHKRHVDAAQQQGRLTDFGASSATVNLNLFADSKKSKKIPVWLHKDNT